MKILRHTENTVANMEKLVDDYHEGMELLSTVLSTIQINLIRGTFTGMKELEGWTRIVDKFTQCHSKIHDKIRANPVCSIHPKSEECQ